MPFKCEECGKSFTKKALFDQHLETHSYEPISCNVCGKKFAHKYSLKQHNKLHTGEEVCKCPDCGKSFQVESYLRDHMKRKHNFVAWSANGEVTSEESADTVPNMGSDTETFEIGCYQNGVYKVTQIQVSKSEVDKQLLSAPPPPFCLVNSPKISDQKSYPETESNASGSILSQKSEKDNVSSSVNQKIVLHFGEQQKPVKTETTPHGLPSHLKLKQPTETPKNTSKKSDVQIIVLPKPRQEIPVYTHPRFVNIAPKQTNVSESGQLLIKNKNAISLLGATGVIQTGTSVKRQDNPLKCKTESQGGRDVSNNVTSEKQWQYSSRSGTDGKKGLSKAGSSGQKRKKDREELCKR